MFINCPSCRALVATDPATDLPPERCPRCAVKLRGDPAAETALDAAAAGDDDARSGVAAAIAEVFDGHDADEVDPAARPAVSLATLLEPAIDATPDPVAEPCQDTADTPADPPQAAPPGPHQATARRATGRAAPSFARRRRDAGGPSVAGRRWPIPAAIIGLCLLLAVQWLLADRARLAADPGWRPVVAGTCAVLRCRLPPWHEPAAFVLLERDVRPHPDARDTLRITASFRNDARWAQAWPEVVLTLSDIDGRPLGTRAFTAAEYLAAAPSSALVDSGQGAVIHIDVVEPGPGAVSFAFDFH